MDGPTHSTTKQNKKPPIQPYAHTCIYPPLTPDGGGLQRVQIPGAEDEALVGRGPLRVVLAALAVSFLVSVG